MPFLNFIGCYMGCNSYRGPGLIGLAASSSLIDFGFFCSISDSSMFVYRHGGCILVLLLYVDDIVLNGNDEAFLSSCVTALGTHFAMKDLGTLHYFLSIEVSHTSQGLFLSQLKYVADVLLRAHMTDIKPMSTPMVLWSSIDDTTPFFDVILYRSLVGALQYLTMTRPDLSFAVNSVCQYMHAPTISHFGMVKRILRYVKGTLDRGLRIVRDRSLALYAFSDSDWAGCLITWCSTTSFCTFLGANCISWSAKKQPWSPVPTLRPSTGYGYYSC
ncbi:uncharacterized mitochondrial protein AtMg00810-like [Macadamia integrifolia]|uniref:uncharacterized mitochondrial protein AtMg00810-like n=1 Tax=Macadamia integrifolia TaxID=60698 RepID=UPI001C4E52B2|nr:uncharacterized mitochondrial protein AtMg00810-like [Macadamia integrifolia]